VAAERVRPLAHASGFIVSGLKRLRESVKRTPLRRRAKNKFGVADKWARVYNGREYHSQAEARYAAKLDLMLKAIKRDARLDLRHWEPQVPVKLEVNGELVTTYIVDFVLEFSDGHKEWHEVKGFSTPEWAIKHKLFRALFPTRNLVVIPAGSIR